MKRFLAVCLLLTILISLFVGFEVAAADKLFVAKLEYDGTTHNYEGTYFHITVNGKEVDTPIPPIVLSGGRSIVPVREIFEAVGAQVYWTEGKPSRVVIANSDTTVSLAIGNNVAKVNGQEVKMEVAAKLIGYDGIGKTMVPVRFVAETLNMDVDYNADKGLIAITEKKPEPKPEAKPEAKPEPEPEKLPSNKLTKVTYSLSGNTLTAKLTFASPIAHYSRMVLKEPNRVVVDVEDGYIATGQYSYTGKGNTTKIRLGDYEGCARVVFDVEEVPQVRISLSSNQKVMTVVLTNTPSADKDEEDEDETKDPVLEDTEKLPSADKDNVTGKGPIVVIDAGHGGSDPGAIGYDEDGNELLYEKNVNLNISRQVEALLKESGVRVYMTRDDDSTVSLSERTEYANALGASLFISIHCNSYTSSEMNGSLVMHHTDESIAEEYGVSGRQIANNILKYLPEAMDTVNKGRLNGDAMYVIRKADMPSVIVETAFISNAEDREKLASASYRKAAAEAIAQGILDTLKLVK